MKKTLKDIAQISSGYSNRQRIENDLENGSIHIIQLQNLDSSNTKIQNLPHKIKSVDVPTSQLLQKGDVLVIAKGSRNNAIVFNENYPAAAVSLFFVLRPNTELITSNYLAWYINQEATQAILHTGKAGTSVQSITKDVLANLEIKVPSVFTQNKLVNLYEMWKVERNKTLELMKEKDKFYNNMVLTEIEREHEVPPFTDEYGQWAGYWHLSNYHIAHLKFKESIILKENPKPVKELYGIITKMEAYHRTIKYADGSSRGYSAVKHWEIFQFGKVNLDKWNGNTNPKIPHNQVVAEILNIIPHSLIESINMVDRQGNIIKN